MQTGILSSLEYEVRSDDLDNKIRFVNSEGYVFVEESKGQYFKQQKVYKDLDMDELIFTMPSVIYPAVIVQTSSGTDDVVARLYKNDMNEEHFLQVFDFAGSYGTKKDIPLGRGSMKILDVADNGAVLIEKSNGAVYLYSANDRDGEKIESELPSRYLRLDNDGELDEYLLLGTKTAIQSYEEKTKSYGFPFLAVHRPDGSVIVLFLKTVTGWNSWFSFTTVEELHLMHFPENEPPKDFSLTEVLDFSPGETKDYSLKGLLFVNKAGGMALEVEDNDGEVHRIFVSPEE